jgi:hypothetical protein
VDFPSLQATVQRNCHISDARHGGNYSLCVYLLKMREYYRWEKGYQISDPLPRSEVGEWLTSREALWESLAERDYENLDIEGRSYDPFDSDSINAVLAHHGLVYSGGFGAAATPHFFLGELRQQEDHSEFTLLISGREFARDLTAPPAMTQGKTIYIRRESLRRTLWEKVDGWAWSKPRNAMGRALAQFDIGADLDGALDAMTEHQIRSVLLHEMGEVQGGQLLGPDWRVMLAELPHSKAELVARAVKDHLADCLVTLPHLLDEAEPAALHLYFANLSNMRKALFPALSAAYAQWVDTGSRESIAAAVQRGSMHWLEVAQQILTLHRTHGPATPNQIERRIEGWHI